jgi:hypothetical protein
MHAAAVRQLIERRYAIAHGAVPAANFPHFCVVDPGGATGPTAALGYRFAANGRLFLEDYLDDPIEAAVSSTAAVSSRLARTRQTAAAPRWPSGRVRRAILTDLRMSPWRSSRHLYDPCSSAWAYPSTNYARPIPQGCRMGALVGGNIMTRHRAFAQA